MDITLKNFEPNLKVVLDAINECDFISFDTELTGLDTNPNSPFSSSSPPPRNFMESLEDRYQFVLKSSAGYQIIQFGLCAYSFDAENERYIAKPFNFYVFPKHHATGCGIVDKRFLMQSSSVNFLASHNFDFNKWIYDGIPYLTRPEENFLNGKGPNEIQLGPQEVEFLNQTCRVVEKWKEDSANNLSGDSIELPPSNAFLRRILYQELPKKYSDLHLETVDSSTIKGIKVMRISRNKRKSVEPKTQANGMFRQVIDAMLSSKKPVIGHNMLLDLVHLFNNFVSPLPQTLKEFKEKVSNELGPILDTKHLARHHPALSKLMTVTGLSDAYSITCQEPFSQKPEIYTPQGFDKYTVKNENDSTSHKGTFHEAGFDAFATGNLFIRMAHKVLQSLEQTNESGESQTGTEDSVSPVLSHFSQFVNRIPVVRSDSVIFLQGEDEVPDRTLVAYVFGFPEATTTNDLAEYFKKYTIGSGNPKISWIDIQSCFVSLKGDGNGNDPENGIDESNVWDHLIRPDSKYKVVRFEDYRTGNLDGKSKKRGLEEISNGNGKDHEEESSSSSDDSTYSPSQSDTSSETSEGSLVSEDFEGDIKDVSSTQLEDNEEIDGDHNGPDTKRRKQDKRSSCIIS
eukprot:TRINITY_DN1428_c0_g1_i1.p1 TRINITY_DN1428_c0_g1~~TRINITY_DN1428_c0_g1_i1.p1  ORF type:complete len:627 (-),score=129.92 TRINITY_DN1428_c0_g1_i1:150-2030(-)